MTNKACWRPTFTSRNKRDSERTASICCRAAWFSLARQDRYSLSVTYQACRESVVLNSSRSDENDVQPSENKSQLPEADLEQQAKLRRAAASSNFSCCSIPDALAPSDFMDNLAAANVLQRPVRTLVSIAGVALGVVLVMLFTGSRARYVQ
ncbi:MAG: hypothetical protein WKF84_17435 [Pyrinomonadaceae bacterium]